MSNQTLRQIQDLNIVLNKEFDRSYSQALSERDMWVNQVSRKIRTDQGSVRFPFRINSLDSRVVDPGTAPEHRNILFDDVVIRIKKFMPDGVKALINDFGDPFYRDQVMEEVKGMAQTLNYMKHERMVNALINGDSDTLYTMYDGQLLFSNTHVVGETGATFDNLESGVFSGTEIQRIKTKLRQVPAGPAGKPFPTGNARFICIIPPDLELDAIDILDSKVVAQDNRSNANRFQSITDYIVEPLLTDTNDWYMIMTKPDMMPFVNVEQVVTGTRQLIAETDANIHSVVREQDVFQWSTHSFEEVFPTQFFMMIKVVNA